MADRDQPQQPTHRAYTVIKREGKDDYRPAPLRNHHKAKEYFEEDLKPKAVL